MLRSSLFLSAALFAVSAWAADEIVVSDAWLRAPAPGQAVVGVYLEIASAHDAVLLSATSALAGSAEIHQMRVENGVMKMRRVARVALPAKQVVKLAPGGYHIMLTGLKRKLGAGDQVPIVLTFAGKNKIKTKRSVLAEVRGGAAGDTNPHQH